MKTLIQHKSTAEAIPAGLSDWIEKWAVASLVLDAAQTVDWPESDFELAASTGYAFRPLVMLTVMTYCYATGVYRSKDIESRIRQDEVLQTICRGTFPSCCEIQQFRRRNRNLIRQSLIQAFKSARQSRRRLAVVYPRSCDRRSVPGAGLPADFQPAPPLLEAAQIHLRQAEDFEAVALDE